MQRLKYFDSHAHYDDARFDNDRDELLACLPSSGVAYVVNAGANMASSYAGVGLAKSYGYIFAAVGVHPHEADSFTDEDAVRLEDLVRGAGDRVVAVGEIGLDYYYEHSERAAQRKAFIRQLEIAEGLKMPVIIHSRDAAAETFEIIEASGVRAGVVHCFGGSPEMAEAYIRLGYYIGIGGVVTFPKARVAAEVVARVPLSRILIETDCPYLAPVPNRGKRNDSTNLAYIAERIAEIKGTAIDEVAGTTFSNAITCFGIQGI